MSAPTRRRRHRAPLTPIQREALYNAMDTGEPFVRAIGYARSKTCGDAHAARLVDHEREVRAVADWNAKHAIGTAVVVEATKGRGDTFRTTTRSEAFLGANGGAIFLVGKAGFWQLDFVRAASSEGCCA